MFGRLLTPLRARFDLSPRPEVVPKIFDDVDDGADAENFAKDVLIQLMRNSVDAIKDAQDLNSRVQAMGEMHRIMVEDSCTKDVFRELDGYILLVNVLSILHTSLETESDQPEDQLLTQIVEGERLAFTLIAESFSGHFQNRYFFEIHVGYESLGQALTALVKDPRTADQTCGFLLSLALDNFALSSIFATLRTADEVGLAAFRSVLGTIQHPAAFGLLVTLLTDAPVPDDELLPRAVYALAEHLATVNHRNQALLNSLGLAGPLLRRFLPSEAASSLPPPDRAVIQKLLKRLLDMGISVADARYIFQRVVRADGSLDADALDVVRAGMKAKWPLHFSLEGQAALELKDENVKGLPPTGFSFMMWLWVERLPTTASHIIWTVSSAQSSRVFLKLMLRPDGALELMSSGNREMAVLETAKIARARWTHLALIHYPHRISNPTIRVFIDGVLTDTRNWPFPKPENSLQTIQYTIGDLSTTASAQWCMTSAYMFSLPFSDELPRFFHHLGPRYAANFQTRDLVRFLTYEAATSLNILFSSLASSRRSVSMPGELSPLMKAIRSGVGIGEDSLVFSVSPYGYMPLARAEAQIADEEGEGKASRCVVNAVGATTSRARVEMQGDVVATQPQCLDVAVWIIGGVAIPLRIIELASNPHELSRAVSILTDAIRACWQNSENMERLRGYDVLANLLRQKSQLINMTSFEILFEFLGVNFRTPDQSAIVNAVAYRSLALDFEIWSSTRTEIQRVHLEHFTTILKTSKYKQFNAKQRIAKLSVVRKLLFVLQTDWYGDDVIPDIVAALKVVVQACFSADETIKPVVSYLAANLHEEPSGATSPRSVISRLDWSHSREKAGRVLESFITVLSAPNAFTKFSSALPLTRICLLLLGEHPSPHVASQVLNLIGLALRASQSFNRKFELVSGWTVLRTVLPGSWDSGVHVAAFDVLLGRVYDPGNKKGHEERVPTISCPYILPAILTSLQNGLLSVPTSESAHPGDSVPSDVVSTNVSDVEHLLEELINLQSSSPSFRQLFKSQQTTSLVITAYKALVASAATSSSFVEGKAIRILEKMNHFMLSLALDNTVASAQKQEIMDAIQQSDLILSSESSNNSPIDPQLIGKGKSSKRRSIVGSAHPLVQLVGERVYQKTTARIHEWRKTIIVSERKRLRRTILDLREYHRQAEHSGEWRHILFNERGLWASDPSLQGWALDETEGPCRVRKKLEPQLGAVSGTEVHADASRDVAEPDSDMQSVVQVEVPPWAESYEFTITDTDSDQQWVDDFVDDKHRRVRHELQPGDVIEAVSTVTRIVGVDSSPGLLILGRKHLYMLDGLVEDENGEVVDVHDAPKDLFSVPGTLLELDGKQRAQHWTYEQVTTFSKRTCLFRDVALEIYFKDSRSLLIVFALKKRRQDMSEKLSSYIAAQAMMETKSPMLLRTPLLGKVSAKVFTGFRDEISTAQRRWQAREISNFTYLSIINQASGRTPGDATQYPVFPWVLADYTSDILDLYTPETFRDLTCPMGALTASRREAAESRYMNLQSVEEKPFHYGTHFSSSMIVCHFLIRLAPFTHMFKILQGGDWDLPDRLFSDIARAYHSASQDLRGDVRELIPEFFTCPEFLENTANLDFGIQQNTGERIHDVKLPPWAKQDPLLFITQHRLALESAYVSEHLPAWIDLIWGCKQRDPKSLNVFHPLSYEGSIDLDSIVDKLEREATVGIIHNFGQTPRKVFQTPHPPRIMDGDPLLPLGTLHGVPEHPNLLLQSSRHVSDISAPVSELVLDMISERVLACRAEMLYVPQYPHEQLGWGFVDQSLRLFVDRKVVHVAESISCICATFADSESLVTGSADCTVRLWQLARKDGLAELSQTHIMRSHTGSVLCVAASRAWSVVVSGSEDGTAVIWDLNRAAYVRSIWHDDAQDKSKSGREPIRLVAINDSTGYIATCSWTKLCLHTLNARRIVQLDLLHAHPSEGIITSLAFHEREYSRLGVLATATQNGTIALRTWSAADTPPGEKAQWKFATLKTLKCRESIDGRTPKITALKFVGESLYHGEDTGKVYSWDLPDD